MVVSHCITLLKRLQKKVWRLGCGLTSKQGTLDVLKILDDTAKARLVILKISYCIVCKNLNHKKERRTISLMQYIESYDKHKPDFLVNPERCASVRENLIYQCREYFCSEYFFSKNNCQWNVLKYICLRHSEDPCK